MTATLPRTVAAPKSQRARSLLGNQFVGAVALAVLVGIGWEIMSSLTFVIPSPVQTFTVLIQNLSNPAYLFDLRVTAQAVFLAFVIGTAVGGGIGLLLTQAIQTQKDWEEVTYYIVLTLLMVTMMDMLSGWLRGKLIGRAPNAASH